MHNARDILDSFGDAFAHPDAVADRLRQQGRPVARVIGSDVPRELLLAAGLAPVRLIALSASATPRLMGLSSLPARSRSLIEQLLSLPTTDRIVMSHAEAELPQLFAVLRELAAVGEIHPGAVDFVDLKHLPRESTRDYNRKRLQGLQETLAGVGFSVRDGELRRVIAAANEQQRLLQRIMRQRIELRACLAGVDALRIIGSTAILPPEEHIERLSALQAASLPELTGPRVFLTGSRHESVEWYSLLESCGLTIVGEDHDWGDPWIAERIATDIDPLVALAEPALRRPGVGRSLDQREASLPLDIARCRPDAIIELCFAGEESAPWQSHQTRRLCARHDLPLLVLDGDSLNDPDLVRARVRAFLSGERASVVVQAAPPQEERASGAGGTRSRKSLRSLAAIGNYQREWFAGVRERAAAGEPIAVVNANAPQEILRALDIPFVVNQWWASIVAAKQQSPRYLDLLEAHDYPTEVDSYSAQGLAAAFDDDASQAPWGGLPRPRFLHALNSTDGTSKLFEAWSRETGADLFLFERTIDPRWKLFSDWWEALPDRWDEFLEPQRLDLLTTEMRELIGQLERCLGRSFSMERFTEVMNLVNEQEDYYCRTRDLIARTTPAPVSVVDTMPATMTPQWQRGTIWARDAARAFYEEVSERVAAGEAACPNERVRLMWVGRGMWSDMGFYQRWEASHGAVFVWSMYLALAADGYIRRFDGGRDPLRALAARVVTMGDELRMPTWAAAWHVHEARTHQVDGAVALSDADPFVLRALQRAGIPVLALPLDNYNQQGVDRAAIERSITEFIEGPVASFAVRRR